MKFFLLIFFVTVTTAFGQKVINFQELEREWTTSGDTIVVLNFWATWCKPCVEELPEYEKLNTWIEGKKVKLLLVSLDFKKDISKQLKPFIKRKKLKSRVVLLDAGNPNAWIDRISPEWSGAIPATVIINHKKNSKDFREKQCSFEELQTIVLQFLEK
ncbi:MAG: TlpA family protein disulfide reductase [Ignavibacteria bacterium]|nr:TlpA family protein disulfide reductase [Ignavibacteria bacterium]